METHIFITIKMPIENSMGKFDRFHFYLRFPQITFLMIRYYTLRSTRDNLKSSFHKTFYTHYRTQLFSGKAETAKVPSLKFIAATFLPSS